MVFIQFGTVNIHKTVFLKKKFSIKYPLLYTILRGGTFIEYYVNSLKFYQAI